MVRQWKTEPAHALCSWWWILTPQFFIYSPNTVDSNQSSSFQWEYSNRDPVFSRRFSTMWLYRNTEQGLGGWDWVSSPDFQSCQISPCGLVWKCEYDVQEWAWPAELLELAVRGIRTKVLKWVRAGISPIGWAIDLMSYTACACDHGKLCVVSSVPKWKCCQL